MNDFQKQVVLVIKDKGFEYMFNKMYKHSELKNIIDIEQVPTLDKFYLQVYKNGSEDRAHIIRHFMGCK